MIRENVRQFIERFVSGRDFDDETNLFDKGLVNSLFAMQLIAFLEEKYDIIVENKDIDIQNFKDVNSIVKLIESKQ